MNSIKISVKNEEILQKVLKFVSKFNEGDISVELPDTLADLAMYGKLASEVLSESAIKRYGRIIKDAKAGKNVYKFETTSKAMDFLMCDDLPTKIASNRVV